MFGEPNRIQPALPASAMKTYAAITPQETHWRRATCEEVECPNFLHGWKTTVDEITVLGQQQAYYIRKQSGRKFTEFWEGGLTHFVFEAGQECFARDQHSVPLERPAIFLVRDGDWRGNPRHTSPRIHSRPEDWIEDMQESFDKTRQRVERG
jgi:hypothetical protein